MSLTAPVLTPLLRDGESLSREEFMRRWEAMPDVRWAELIDGVVYMPSPLSDIHGDFHLRLSAWLGFYLAATPGCKALIAPTVLMSDDSSPQPDLALEILPEYGGQSTIEGKYAVGAPELIVEVSHTTNTRDSGVKLRLYERSGVREYLIVRPDKQKITWRRLVNGKYRQVEADADGLFRSQVFPGLWLKPEQLWSSDFAGLSATVQLGAATSEHKAFVKRLSRQMS